jgi:hypothetical protein
MLPTASAGAYPGGREQTALAQHAAAATAEMLVQALYPDQQT